MKCKGTVKVLSALGIIAPNIESSLLQKIETNEAIILAHNKARHKLVSLEDTDKGMQRIVADRFSFLTD